MNRRDQLVKDLGTDPAFLRQFSAIDCDKEFFNIYGEKLLVRDPESAAKKLCDGLSLVLGMNCAMDCVYCDADAITRNHPAICGIVKAGFNPGKFVARRIPGPHIHIDFPRNGVVSRDPRRQVILASPFDDIAGTAGMAYDAAKICEKILDGSSAEIRFLSRSTNVCALVPGSAEHRDRVIFGISTGILNDAVAATLELGVPRVSERLRALWHLQDRGYRTYGMISPVLPSQDLPAFAAKALKAIRVDRCEHVWVQALNCDGKRLDDTLRALHRGGYGLRAQLVGEVSRDEERREEFSRGLFSAFASQTPAGKLRFLHHTTRDTAKWWREQEPLGAVCLSRMPYSYDNQHPNTSS